MIPPMSYRGLPPSLRDDMTRYAAGSFYDTSLFFPQRRPDLLSRFMMTPGNLMGFGPYVDFIESRVPDSYVTSSLHRLPTVLLDDPGMTFDSAPTWAKDLLCVGLWVSLKTSLTLVSHLYVIGINFLDAREYTATKNIPAAVRRYYEDNFM